MNKSMLVGAVLGAVGVAAGGAVVTYSLVDHDPDYAEVVTAQSVKETIKTPCQVRRDTTVTRQRPVKNQRRIASTVIDTVIDDLLGNQVDGGTGKRIATVAGAVDDGYAGNKVQEGMQGRDTYTTTGTRCSTMHNSSEKVVSYDVKYMFDDRAGQIRMEHDSGSQIPVDKNGRLILSRGETLY